MKILFHLILFLFFFTNASLSYACNFNFKAFGSQPLAESQKFSNGFLTTNKNLKTVYYPITNFCSESELKGSTVIFYYLENELAKIVVERHNFNDRALLKYSIQQYGDFKRSEGLTFKEWTGSHFWNTGFQVIAYVAVLKGNNKFEKIEITSSMYVNKLSQQPSQLEK